MNKRIALCFMIAACMFQMAACGKTDDTVNTSGAVSYSENDDKTSDVTVIDVFKDLNVTFEGVNDKGKLKYEYVGDSDFVKEYVWNYSCSQSSGLRNGETVIISLNYNEYKAEQEHIEFKETEHEYTVEGLWGSIVSYEGYDFSEIDDWAYSFFTENEKSEYVKSYLDIYKKEQIDPTDKNNLLKIILPDIDVQDGTFVSTNWQILSITCEPYAKILRVTPNKDDGNENYYSLFYKISIEAEKSSIETNSSSDDTLYNVGDVKEWDYIGEVYLNNVSVEKDSNRVYSWYDSPQNTVFDASEVYNFDFDHNFDTFFNNFLNSRYGKYTYYYMDLNSDDPQWELKN